MVGEFGLTLLIPRFFRGQKPEHARGNHTNSRVHDCLAPEPQKGSCVREAGIILLREKNSRQM